MKSAIIAVCIFACACAASDEKEAQVVRSDYNQGPDGNFQYAYETQNGISGEASGVVKPVGKDEVALEVSGSNTYTSPEGKVFKVTYIANENGFLAQGDHLPTPPAPQPIPEYIAKAIEWTAAHPYTEKKL